ncbi:hypothetical protein IW261DRAFT_1499577 [Armillaria novae-zelandiae]|uniref:Uncharacterized protein n=1 Tax=Armillaria novae-zelandiae TaxID=153914 RepID=A0AA39NYH9_9AGAR|nr:hypothetical protein IW261DRAFT_1499577 [Armillaria novae-zelandiae]
MLCSIAPTTGHQFSSRTQQISMIIPELLVALRIAVTCTFIGCVIVYIYWEEIRKFCQAHLIKLLAALLFCALLMQLDIWLPNPDIVHGFGGDFSRSILLGTKLIIISASRVMAIIMISHITLMLWRFECFKLEILLLEIVVHRLLRIGEALLIGRADGL